jgi:hypothetical protein
MEQIQGKLDSHHVGVGLKVMMVTHKPLGCMILTLHRTLFQKCPWPWVLLHDIKIDGFCYFFFFQFLKF